MDFDYDSILAAGIAGGVGGGLGAAAAYLLGRIFKLSPKAGRMLSIGLVIVGIAASRIVFETWYQPRALSPTVEAELLKVPAHQVMKAHYPAEYAQVLRTVAQGAARGEDQLALINRTRPLVSALVTRQLKLADEKNTVAMMRLVQSQLPYLRARPAVCHAFLTGGPTDEDHSALFPVELQEREAALTAEVLRQAAERPYRGPAPGPEFQAAADRAIAGLTPAELSLMQATPNLQSAENTAAQKALFCRFSELLLEEFLKLPESQAAAFFRAG